MLLVGKEVLSVDASNVAIDLITEVVFMLAVQHLKKIRATPEPFALASCSS